MRYILEVVTNRHRLWNGKIMRPEIVTSLSTFGNTVKTKSTVQKFTLTVSITQYYCLGRGCVSYRFCDDPGLILKYLAVRATVPLPRHVG